MSKTDAVRQSMHQARPQAMSVVHALTITEDGETVVVSGMVPDEATHQALLKAAKDTAGVKSVRDEMKVQKKQ
jgi:osmotically-inducible protein OsmY